MLTVQDCLIFYIYIFQKYSKIPILLCQVCDFMAILQLDLIKPNDKNSFISDLGMIVFLFLNSFSYCQKLYLWEQSDGNDYCLFIIVYIYYDGYIPNDVVCVSFEIDVYLVSVCLLQEI